MTRNGWWWVGALVSAVTAMAGQAEMLPEPLRHYVSTAGIVCSVLTSVNAKWPKADPPATRRRRRLLKKAVRR